MTEQVELPVSRPTHPALFALCILPFGVAVGFLQNAMPFLLRAQKVEIAVFSSISAVAFLPHTFKIFWAPLIDFGGRRRLWYFGGALTTATMLGVAALIGDLAHHLTLLTCILIAMEAAAATCAASLQSLMATTTRLQDKGKAAGFYMAGNIGWTSILGVLPVWLFLHLSPTAGSLILVAVTVASSLGALFIEEPPPPARPEGIQAGSLVASRFRAIAKDAWTLLKSREGWTGLVICAAPVGCGALTNLFTGFATDYQVSEHKMELIAGLGSGLVGAAGSLCGGYLADRLNRRMTYVLAGGITALSAFAMAAFPLNVATYTWGTLVYSFANGIAFAAFAAMVLEMVSSGVAVTTKYILFVATANLAISYTEWLDGQASKFHNLGAVASIRFDGILTFLGIAVVLAMLALTRRSAPRPQPAG